MKTLKGRKQKLPFLLTRCLLFILPGVILFAACSTVSDSNQDPLPGELDDPGESQDLDSDAEEADLENGERIYFTASNQEGERITYSGGPNFGGMMMGNYLTCASCHGPEAQGGRHRMHMQVMDAPAITYDALSSEGEEHGEEGDEHADEHGQYDLEAFRTAVVEGQHPDGEPLDENMPRWNIRDYDLRDLFAFLQALPDAQESNRDDTVRTVLTELFREVLR